APYLASRVSDSVADEADRAVAVVAFRPVARAAGLPGLGVELHPLARRFVGPAVQRPHAAGPRSVPALALVAPVDGVIQLPVAPAVPVVEPDLPAPVSAGSAVLTGPVALPRLGHVVVRLEHAAVPPVRAARLPVVPPQPVAPVLEHSGPG